MTTHTQTRRSPQRMALRRIIAMEIVSGVGDGVFWVGLVAILFRLDVGPAGFAAAVVVRLGPRALFGAPAGVIVDMVDRRRLLVGLDLGRGICMIVLAVIAGNGVGEFGLLIVVLVTYVLAAPYRPAVTAGLALLTSEEFLSAANAQVNTVRQIMTFVGPLIGAAVVKWGTPESAFWLNAVTFVLAGALVGSIRALSVPRSPRLTSATALPRRWSRVLATPGLIVLSGLVCVMYFVRGSELVLFALAADERLDLGPAGIGLLTGAVGLGALAVLPMTKRLAGSARPDVVLLVSLSLNAVPIAALGWVRSPVVAVVVLMLVGAGVVIFESASVVMLLGVAHSDVFGRVLGLVASASNGGKLAGALAAPLLVACIELRGALVVSGVLVVAAAVIAAQPLRALARSTNLEMMRLRPTVDALASLALFEGASRPALQRLASAVTEEVVGAGVALIREGDVAADLFIMRSGTFEATVGERHLNDLQRDDWFGEIGLIRRVPRTATVTARADATVWRAPDEAFFAALADVAAAPTALLEEMSVRLRRVGRSDLDDAPMG